MRHIAPPLREPAATDAVAAAPRTVALARAVAARLVWRGVWGGAAVGALVASLWALRLYLWVPLEAAPISLAARIGVNALSLIPCVVVGALLGAWWARVTRPDVGRTIEAAVPQSRNLLLTALELSTTSSQRGPVPAAVCARAEALVSSLTAKAIVPFAGVQRFAAVAIGVWGLAAVLAQFAVPGAASRVARRAVATVSGPRGISRLDVRVEGPAYARTPPRADRNPTRVEALEGSLLTFTVAADVDSLRVETADSVRVWPRPASGDFTWPLRLRDDGFVIVTALGDSTVTGGGARRLVALSMRRDGAPVVRITAPGKDLIVPSADRTLDVRIDASDDLALGTLQLHYTKVSGSGERFTFSEGTLPVQITRGSASEWKARGALALATLLQEPGDVVVYRARATDTRPGSVPVESDAFIAELAAAGGVAALGFSMDPDEDRYAVSQQMVIMKTERLIASRAKMGADSVAEQADLVAQEQRRVRAEFVFMTGGEFEQALAATEEGIADLDETAEAESEGDLGAGRMANRGRASLLTAIRAMSRAAIALTERNLPEALRLEKLALTNLQDAFARQRFLMRALSQREALDPARRHTGALDSVARVAIVAPEPPPDADRVALRAVLDELITLDLRDATASTRLGELSVRVLQVNARARVAQRIAQWLQAASAQPLTSGSPRDSAATALSVWIGEAERGAPGAIGAGRRAQREALQRARAAVPGGSR
jgi:hypothetical protein